MSSDLKILITNDDGFDAKGISVLAGIMRQFGSLTVIAPKSPVRDVHGSDDGRSSAGAQEVEFRRERTLVLSRCLSCELCEVWSGQCVLA